MCLLTANTLGLHSNDREIYQLNVISYKIPLPLMTLRMKPLTHQPVGGIYYPNPTVLKQVPTPHTRHKFR